MPKGGALKSVYIVTDENLRVNGGKWILQQGPALKVRGFTEDTIGSRKIKGGDALPVYVVPEADLEINSGRWKVYAGEPVQVTDVIGAARGIIQGHAVPVMPVDANGDYDPDFPIPTGLTWLLRDDFSTDVAAGSVDDTLADPGPGLRDVVTDTNLQLAIAGGEAVFSAGGVGAGDPSMWYEQYSKVLGMMLLIDITPTGAGNRGEIGWNDNQVGNVRNGFTLTFSGISQFGPILENNSKDLRLGFGANNNYRVAIIRRNSGFYYFLTGSAYTNWLLVWSGLVHGTDDYPSLSTGNAVPLYKSSFVRIPDAYWLPEPVASDGFTDPNGTSLDAHSTDGQGHPEGVAGGLGAGGDGLSWTEQNGNFDIQTNRANIAVSSGARDVATVSAGDSDIHAVVTIRKTNAVDSGEFGFCLRYTDNNNFWMIHADLATNIIEIVERNGGVETQRASAGFAFTHSTNYELKILARGQEITCYVNDATRVYYASAALNENVTVHGIVGDGTNQSFDNFVIWPHGSDGEFDSVLDLYVQP